MKEQVEFSKAWKEFFNQNYDLFVDKIPDLSAGDYYDYFYDKEPYVSIISPILYKPEVLRKYEDKIVKHYFNTDGNIVKYHFILQLTPKNHLTFTVFYMDSEYKFYGAFLFCGPKAEHFKEFINENKEFEINMDTCIKNIGFR